VQLNPFTQPPLTRQLTIWRRAKLPRSNFLYVFNLFTNPWGRKRVERWLGLLDLVVWLHGAIGLIYALILDEKTTYSLKFPEFYYLLLIYMSAAVVSCTFKVVRYVYLFRYLPRKLEEEDLQITQMQ
jgi:hypothetical protein